MVSSWIRFEWCQSCSGYFPFSIAGRCRLYSFAQVASETGFSLARDHTASPRLDPAPALAGLDLDLQWRLEVVGRDHPVGGKSGHHIDPSSSTSKTSSSCTCMIMSAPSGRSLGARSTIATLMMSAADPCTRALNASLSPASGMFLLELLSSGT